jgi:hypothetical protein
VVDVRWSAILMLLVACTKPAPPTPAPADAAPAPVVSSALPAVVDATPPDPCPEAGLVEVQILTHAELVDNPRTWIRLKYGEQLLEIAEIPRARKCTSDGTADDRTITCEGEEVCKLHVAPGDLTATCARKEKSLTLPTCTKARLPRGALPQTVHYH